MSVVMGFLLFLVWGAACGTVGLILGWEARKASDQPVCDHCRGPMHICTVRPVDIERREKRR